MESDAEPPGEAAALQELTRIDPVLAQQVRVLVGVDRVGQLLLGRARLVLLPLRAEQVEDRVLVDLHGWLLGSIEAGSYPAAFSRIIERTQVDGAAAAARTFYAFASMETSSSPEPDEEAGMTRPIGSSPGERGAAWRTRWAAPPRTAYTSETKPFFLTSEFLVFVLFVMGLGIGASTSAQVDARLFWILTTIATAFYMLSRGIAKSGSRSRAYDPREDVDLGRRGD
jgi:hypothetical protein